jgi:tetratricopeptide (TPR) repeat protein
MVMDYIDAPNLMDFIASKGAEGISDEEKTQISRGVHKALKDAQREGISHDGISPGDIFILKNKRVKVSDFKTNAISLCEDIVDISDKEEIFALESSQLPEFEDFKKHFCESFLSKFSGPDMDPERNWPHLTVKPEKIEVKYERGKDKPDQDRIVKIQIWNGNPEGLGILMLDEPIKPKVKWIKKIETENLTNIEDKNRPGIIRLTIDKPEQDEIDERETKKTELTLRSQPDPSSTENPYPGEEKTISIKAEFAPSISPPNPDEEEDENPKKNWKPLLIGVSVLGLIALLIVFFKFQPLLFPEDEEKLPPAIEEIETTPETDELIKEAQKARQNKNPQKAIQTATKVVESDEAPPEDKTKALYVRGEAKKDNKDLKGAKEDFIKAAELTKEDPNEAILQKLIEVLNRLGEVEEAMQRMENALQNTQADNAKLKKINENLIKANKQLQEMSEAFTKNNFDDTIAAATSTIQTEPNMSEAYYYRGLAYYAKRQYERAKEDYQKAIELNNSDPKYYAGLAEVFFDSEDYVNAKENTKEGLELDPNNKKLNNIKNNLEVFGHWN